MSEVTVASEVGEAESTQSSGAVADSPPTATNRVGDAVLAWSREHPVQAGVAAAVVLLTSKLLFVARGDTTTALALVQYASPVKAIIGTALANISIFGAGLFVIAIAWLAGAIGRRRDPGLVALVCIPLLAITVLVVPLPSTVEWSAQTVLASGLVVLTISFVTLQAVLTFRRWRWAQNQTRLEALIKELGRAGSHLTHLMPEQARLLGQEAVELWSKEAKDRAAPSPVGQVLTQLLSSVQGALKRRKDEEIKRGRDPSILLDNSIEYVKSESSRWQETSTLHASHKEGYEALRKLAAHMDDMAGMARGSAELRNSELAPFFAGLHDHITREYQELLTRERAVRAARLPVDLSAVAAGASLVLIALITLTSSDMWLPAQELSLRGTAPIVGYVLGEQGDSTIVLVEESRAVQQIKTADITSRTVCAVGERLNTTSLYARFSGAGPRSVNNACVSALAAGTKFHERVLITLAWILIIIAIPLGLFLGGAAAYRYRHRKREIASANTAYTQTSPINKSLQAGELMSPPPISTATDTAPVPTRSKRDVIEGEVPKIAPPKSGGWRRLWQRGSKR